MVRVYCTGGGGELGRQGSYTRQLKTRSLGSRPRVYKTENEHVDVRSA